MKPQAEVFIALLLATVSLIALLFILFLLPRLIRKKESDHGQAPDMTHVAGAFTSLGNEIKALKEQLVMKERLAVLGEVSAGIAHEFRNPMAVITGYAKLLLKDLSPDDIRRDLAQGILKEVEEMDQVMRELLKFSKSEPLHKSETDLAKLFNDITQTLGDDAARVEVSSNGSLTILGDEVLLKQAIKNLIQNGLEAGSKVWVEIGQTSQDGQEAVTITIKDNGPGIEKEDKDSVFMPFYTTKEKGLGIGLSLVQKIALAHGGTISVESTKGQGCTFTLSLPR